MDAPAPACFTAADELVEAVLARVGRRVVLGIPVGIGKPVAFVNALTSRACRDPGLDLTILTALSLDVPQAAGELGRRFLEPLVERVFGDTPRLHYLELLRSGTLPPNITLAEFYLTPGAWLDEPAIQRNYLSSNYTHVVRDGLQRGLNVLAQLVARPPPDEAPASGPLSLGSNADLTVDLLPHIAAARAAGRAFVFVGQLHDEMPYMHGDALVPREVFDFLLQERSPSPRLFALPNRAIPPVDHFIGLAASALVKDGGTLQLGIGELGDAIAHALILRHEQPAAWRRALDTGGTLPAAAALIEREGGTTPFQRGVYACSEMLVDGFLELYRHGILARRVYPSVLVQQLLNEGAIGEQLDAGFVDALHAAGVRRLSSAEFQEMHDVGVWLDAVRYENGELIAPDGSRIAVHLDDPASRAQIARQCLGRRLRGGVLVDAGFFLGPSGFYAALRQLPPDERRQFAMRAISFVNELQGPQSALKVVQRHAARFVNTAMMVTGLGAAVSDGLEDGRMVSGVGGQYNFVAMAHALPGARSILCVRSTREHQGRITSNLVWAYGHQTIPRHLRDIVVTEYGIADLRGRTDGEVAAALIAVADSRFQPALVAAAVAAHKLPRDYRIPQHARQNTPERLADAARTLAASGLMPEYPFGSDLTTEERTLTRALAWLAGRRSWGARLSLLADVIGAVPASRTGAAEERVLERLALHRPVSISEHLWRRMVLAALAATPAGEGQRLPRS